MRATCCCLLASVGLVQSCVSHICATASCSQGDVCTHAGSHNTAGTARKPRHGMGMHVAKPHLLAVSTVHWCAQGHPHERVSMFHVSCSNAEVCVHNVKHVSEAAASAQHRVPNCTWRSGALWGFARAPRVSWTLQCSVLWCAVGFSHNRFSRRLVQLGRSP